MRPVKTTVKDGKTINTYLENGKYVKREVRAEPVVKPEPVKKAEPKKDAKPEEK